MSGEVFKTKSSETPKQKEIMNAMIPFKNEVTGLENIVKETYIDNLYHSKNTPKGIRRDSYVRIVGQIDFTDSGVKNLVDQINDEDRSRILYAAAILKMDSNGILNDVDAIKKAKEGKDFSSLFCEYCDDGDIRDIMKLIYKAIDEGKSPFENISIPENILIADVNITNKFKDNGRFLDFDGLDQEKQRIILIGIIQKYKDLLRDSIQKALGENPGTSASSLLYNNDGILNLFVNYYNSLLRLQNISKGIEYSPLIYEHLSEEDKQKLKTYFNGWLDILCYETDGEIDENVLKEIEETNKRIREENQRMLEEWEKRSKEINDGIYINNSNDNDKELNSTIASTIKSPEDIQSASGADIAENAGLGKQLTEQYNNDGKNVEDLQSNEQIFSMVWPKFIKSHDELNSYITEEIMLKLYDKSTNTIKDLDNKARDQLKEIFQDYPDKLTEVYKQLLIFPDEINNAKIESTENLRFAETVKDENKNNETIGAIIDNVRDIFKGNDRSSSETGGNLPNKGLKLKEQEPVIIEGDNLVISGVFNGADVIVRYNLKSGEIFMNSFVQYDDDNSKMIIGSNSVANYKVGQLASFDNMLSNHELSDSEVSLLSDIIADSSKKQSAMNSIVIKLMKTFNMTQNEQEEKNIVLDGGSDLFDFLQIIKNTENLDTIEKFQNFMEIVMNYACLKRGDNNLQGSQRNQGNRDYYDITFNNDNKDEYITTIRDCAESFSRNPLMFRKTENINSSYQLGFIDLIKKYIINDVSKPNWKLAPDKIDDFINHLKNDDKEQVTTH